MHWVESFQEILESWPKISYVLFVSPQYKRRCRLHCSQKFYWLHWNMILKLCKEKTVQMRYKNGTPGVQIFLGYKLQMGYCTPEWGTVGNPVRHPPYSPDSAPSDYYLFPLLKEYLKARCYEDRSPGQSHPIGSNGDLSESLVWDCNRKSSDVVKCRNFEVPTELATIPILSDVRRLPIAIQYQGFRQLPTNLHRIR